MNEMWLSFIIPAYNPDLKLFEKCINSINCRNFEYEILIVDDGSTNGIKEFVENSLNNQIRYIYQNNCGVSTARNTGIFNARGKYIYFLDADDELSSEWCDYISDHFSSINDDYVIFGVKDCNPITLESKNRYIRLPENVQLDNKQLLCYFLTTSIMNECWGKLINKSLLIENQISFITEIIHAEDKIFNYEVLKHSSSCKYVPIISYLYRYELKNENRLINNQKVFLDNRYIVTNKEIEAAEFCTFGEQQEKLKKAIYQSKIITISSDIVKIMKNKKWTNNSKCYVIDFINKVDLFSNIKFCDLKSNRVKILYICLKGRLWFVFWILSILKRIK